MWPKDDEVVTDGSHFQRYEFEFLTRAMPWAVMKAPLRGWVRCGFYLFWVSNPCVDDLFSMVV